MKKIFHHVLGVEGHSVFGAVNELELDYWDRLPLVPAVTSFLIRKQNRRRWKPDTLAHMLARFPRLQEIHYEPWRRAEVWQGLLDAGYEGLFESIQSSNKTLKKIVIFEDFEGVDYEGYETKRRPTPAVGRMVALASLGLEHLAASFIVDASDFFQAEAAWKWPSLSSLVLTSKYLTPDEELTKIGAMLRAAAAAAMKMPQLETMEIWNGRQGLAALFKYQTSRKYRQATITWRATWRLSLEQSVIDAWEAALRQWGGWRLNFVQEILDEALIKSHGDAIHCLMLTNEVIRPISLQQILFEQKAMHGRKDEQQG